MAFPINHDKKNKIIELLDIKCVDPYHPNTPHECDRTNQIISILESCLDEHYLPLDYKGTVYEKLTTGEGSKSRHELTSKIDNLQKIQNKTSDLKHLIDKLDSHFQNRLSERVSIQLPKLNLPTTSQHKIVPVNAILDLIEEECAYIANDFGSAYKKLLAMPLQSLEEFWIFTLQKPPPPMTEQCLFNRFAAILLDRTIETIHKARKDNR